MSESNLRQATVRRTTGPNGPKLQQDSSLCAALKLLLISFLYHHINSYDTRAPGELTKSM